MHVDILPDKDKPGFFIVAPHGSIDSDTYLDFQGRVTPLLVKSTRGVIIDLSRVDYISSAGLGVIFTMRKALLGNAGELLFSNVKPQIKRLFDIVKALPKESIFESTEEADRYFYKIMNEEIERQKRGGRLGGAGGPA